MLTCEHTPPPVAVRPERLTSTYIVECLCSLSIETEHRELVCPDCGRMLVVDWGKA